MTQTPIRITHGYWCHSTGHPPDHCLVATAAQAMDWIRASVRRFAGGAEHGSFMVVWRWLGDDGGLHETLRRLRSGEGYVFGVDTELGRCAWSVHPVLVLPVVPSD